MKMIRFLGSIILAVTAFILMKLAAGSWWTIFLDMPTFIIVGIFPLLYQLILFGSKNFKNAFSSPLKKESSTAEAAKALDFFKTYGKAVWAFSMGAIGISLIGVFSYLDDPKLLAPNLAVTFIAFLYPVLINLFLILPYKAIIKQCLSESEF